MSEHINERLSEFVDDEMSVEECQFFVRHLQLNEEARGKFFRYQLVGAAVRGEHIHHNAADLSQRLRRALESDGVDDDSARQRRLTKTRFVTIAGIAASFALMAVVVFNLADSDVDAFGSRDNVLADTGSDSANLAGAAVPGSAAEAQQLARVQAEVMGIQYLIHHTGYSSGLNRTIMHSSVVAGRGEELAGPTEAGPLD